MGMIAIGPQGLDYYEPSRSHYVLTIMSESTLMTKGYFVDAYYVSNGVLIETSQCGTDDFDRIISSFFKVTSLYFGFSSVPILKRNTNFVRFSSAI